MTRTELSLLISEDRTEEVLNKLLTIPEIVNTSGTLFNEIILFKSRYKRLLNEKSKGFITYEEYEVQINKINQSILDTLKMMPDISSKVNPNKPITKGNKIVVIQIDENLYNFNFQKLEYLVGAISGLLMIERDEIIVRAVKEGSIYIALELSASKAKDLNQSFRSKKLHNAIIFKIIDLRLMKGLVDKKLLGLFLSIVIWIILYNSLKQSTDFNQNTPQENIKGYQISDTVLQTPDSFVNPTLNREVFKKSLNKKTQNEYLDSLIKANK